MPKQMRDGPSTRINMTPQAGIDMARSSLAVNVVV
jgi:hypothetical protein